MGGVRCVDSCHVDPGFLHVDPPFVTAIRVRALVGNKNTKAIELY